MRGLGAELVVHGRDFDDAREHCERLAARARLPLRPLRERAGADRRRRHGDARDPRGAAGDRGDRRPDRRRQRRRRRVHRREGDQPGGAGDRRPVGAARPAAYRSWRERPPRRGPDGDVRRGPRHAHRVRAAAADPPGAPRRLRARRATTSSAPLSATMIETTRNLVEAAGASPLAAALRLRDELAGKRVALIAERRQRQPEQLRERARCRTSCRVRRRRPARGPRARAARRARGAPRPRSGGRARARRRSTRAISSSVCGSPSSSRP